MAMFVCSIVWFLGQAIDETCYSWVHWWEEDWRLLLCKNTNKLLYTVPFPTFDRWRFFFLPPKHKPQNQTPKYFVLLFQLWLNFLLLDLSTRSRESFATDQTCSWRWLEIQITTAHTGEQAKAEVRIGGLVHFTVFRGFPVLPSSFFAFIGGLEGFPVANAIIRYSSIHIIARIPHSENFENRAQQIESFTSTTLWV